jgi:hypothetical protein
VSGVAVGCAGSFSCRNSSMRIRMVLKSSAARDRDVLIGYFLYQLFTSALRNALA